MLVKTHRRTGPAGSVAERTFKLAKTGLCPTTSRIPPSVEIDDRSPIAVRSHHPPLCDIRIRIVLMDVGSIHGDEPDMKDLAHRRRQERPARPLRCGFPRCIGPAGIITDANETGHTGPIGRRNPFPLPSVISNSIIVSSPSRHRPEAPHPGIMARGRQRTADVPARILVYHSRFARLSRET